MQSLIMETLRKRGAEISGLVDMYQKSDPAFLAKTVEWMRATEVELSFLKYPLVSCVAAERGRILAYGDDLKDTLGFPTGERAGPGQRAAALAALGRLDAEMRANLKDLRGQLDEFSKKIAEMIAMVSRQIPLPIQNGMPRDVWIEEVWRRISEADSIRELYNYVSASLPRVDRTYLLGEILDRLLSNRPI